MVMNQTSKEIKAYYSMFLRYRGWFLAPFVVVASVVALSSLFFPKVYESSTVIRVQRQQPNPIGTNRLVHEDLQEVLKTLQEMVLSRPRLLETIEKLSLDQDVENPIELEMLIRSIRKRVSLRRRGTELFSVSYQDGDPEKAMQVTKTIVNLFIDESLFLKREEAFSSVDFIQKQLETYESKLEQAEEALRGFKQAHLGEMPGEQNANLVQLERTRDTLATTSMELQEAIARKRFIEKQISGEKPMVVSMKGGEATSAEEKIQILEFQLSQLLATYTEKHPDIVRIRSEIALLSKQGNRALKTSPGPGTLMGDLTTLNPLHQRLKEDYNNISIRIGTLQTKKRVLEDKVGEYEEKVMGIPNQEKELVSLQRDYNVNDRIYQMLLMKLEEAKISKHLEFSRGGTRFQIIEPAIVPVTPIKPNRLKFVAAGMALGCAAGVGLIFLKEYFNTATRGVRQTEEVYQLPVLATIPVILTEKEIQVRRKNRRLWIIGSVFFTVSMLGMVAAALILKF